MTDRRMERWRTPIVRGQAMTRRGAGVTHEAMSEPVIVRVWSDFV